MEGGEGETETRRKQFQNAESVKIWIPLTCAETISGIKETISLAFDEDF